MWNISQINKETQKNITTCNQLDFEAIEFWSDYAPKTPQTLVSCRNLTTSLDWCAYLSSRKELSRTYIHNKCVSRCFTCKLFSWTGWVINMTICLLRICWNLADKWEALHSCLLRQAPAFTSISLSMCMNKMNVFCLLAHCVKLITR